MSETTHLDLDSILPLVRKPGRYVGGELHAVSDSFEADLRYCLVFPDLYEIGMSHQGLQILYHILNDQGQVLAHRTYAPDIDMEKELRHASIPLFSLEAKKELKSYDVIGFTLPYELCYTNILTVLDLAGIPLRAAQRCDGDPLIIGGGSCSLNPEPVAAFFDAIILGDGEEVIVELSKVLLKGKQQGLDRNGLLESLASIDGVYIPSYFAAQYDQGQFVGVVPNHPEYTLVKRRVLPEMPPVKVLQKPLVPVVKPVHDRLGVEIARGCTRGCRFCQAGIIYRPVRERSIDDILELAEKGIGSSGFDELALLSLSTGDFSCLGPLMGRLMDRFVDDYVSVSMPSMRVGTLTPDIMEQIRRVRKTGFTVAPEAGSERLRQVINKGISEEDLLKTAKDAFSLGWNLLKLYFMIGLPTETMEDVEQIVELAKKTRQEGLQGRGGKAQINISVATFVPKPHTPFQWARQLSLEESKQRIDLLKKITPRKGFKLKWHDPYQSYLEGVFSRGDRRLADLIETAWQSGVRLDGWSEHFSLSKWQQAAQQCGVELDQYLCEKDMGAPLPWDHLESGTDREFLEQEYGHALERIYTSDCRVHGCHKCGLCDFTTIKPVVNTLEDVPLEQRTPTIPPARRSGQETAFAYRVHYSRLGNSRFYGHLEVLQLIFRALQRSQLPVLFSNGFNPSPKVSFSQALPVGVESYAEYFDVEVSDLIKNVPAAKQRLDDEFPGEITVTAIEFGKHKDPAGIKTVYSLIPFEPVEGIEDKIANFLSAKEWIVERVRKKKRRELDLRPLVEELSWAGNALTLKIKQIRSEAGTNPREILEKVLGVEPRTSLQARIIKHSVEEFDPAG